MFDALQRYVYNEETGQVSYVKDQVGRPLDEPVAVGEPLDDEHLAEITTIYRNDNVSMREDEEAIEVVETIHEARTKGGYGLGVFKNDLKCKLGDD
jgi:methyl-coenzyme M reductase gamma subunit